MLEASFSVVNRCEHVPSALVEESCLSGIQGSSQRGLREAHEQPMKGTAHEVLAFQRGCWVWTHGVGESHCVPYRSR